MTGMRFEKEFINEIDTPVKGVAHKGVTRGTVSCTPTIFDQKAKEEGTTRQTYVRFAGSATTLNTITMFPVCLLDNGLHRLLNQHSFRQGEINLR